ncbi:hypothetical protein KC335_g2251, partial [Hortaea werneckii]
GEAVGEESQNQGDEDELDCVYLVSGTTEAEKKLWKGVDAPEGRSRESESGRWCRGRW